MQSSRQQELSDIILPLASSEMNAADHHKNEKNSTHLLLVVYDIYNPL